MTYGFIGTGNMGGALARAAAKAVEVRSSIVLANRRRKRPPVWRMRSARRWRIT